MLTITLFARAAFSINAPIVFPPKQRITSHSKITLASLKSQFNVGILLRDVRANINYYKDLSLGLNFALYFLIYCPYHTDIIYSPVIFHLHYIVFIAICHQQYLSFCAFRSIDVCVTVIFGH